MPLSADAKPVATKTAVAAKTPVEPPSEAVPVPAVTPKTEAPRTEVVKRKKTAPRAKPVEPAGPRRKVLILGDSMAATDFGRALQKRLNAHRALRVARRGKSSTGLARPDFFDWMAEAKRQLKRHKPELVVVIIGGNDGQDLIPKTKKRGRRVHWNKPKWKTAYAERVKAFARLLMGEDRRVAWLELPAMDRRRFERKLTFIRDVQKQALAELGPRVRYVSTRDIFYDDKGRLVRKIRAGKKKKRTPLRQEDGIHFSLKGSQYFADRVLPSLYEQWSLRP